LGCAEASYPPPIAVKTAPTKGPPRSRWRRVDGDWAARRLRTHLRSRSRPLQQKARRGPVGAVLTAIGLRGGFVPTADRGQDRFNKRPAAVPLAPSRWRLGCAEA